MIKCGAEQPSKLITQPIWHCSSFSWYPFVWKICRLAGFLLVYPVSWRVIQRVGAMVGGNISGATDLVIISTCGCLVVPDTKIGVSVSLFLLSSSSPLMFQSCLSQVPLRIFSQLQLCGAIRTIRRTREMCRRIQMWSLIAFFFSMHLSWPHCLSLSLNPSSGTRHVSNLDALVRDVQMEMRCRCRILSGSVVLQL